MTGYTQTELDDVQAKWEFRFPPDLLAFLREKRFVIDRNENDRSLDWIHAEPGLIQDSFNWPFEGFVFDVQNGLWWPEWGEMPAKPEDRVERLKEIFKTVPKLISVYGHRYIPEEPHESGNPIFSIWQMDIIHYGANLDDYIAREIGGYDFKKEWPPLKEIPFWGRAVQFNLDRFRNGGSFTFLNRNSVLPE